MSGRYCAQAISLLLFINCLNYEENLLTPERVFKANTACTHLLDERVVSEHLAGLHDSHYSSL